MSHLELPDIESLRFEGVSFRHEGHDPVLLNCDFEFPAGRTVLLKSPEGAGKSTLLQIMAGLALPQSGSYYVNDENVVPMSFEEFLPYRLRIGFSFDYGGLINNRTLEDNLLLPLLYHKILDHKAAHVRVAEALSRFDMRKYRNERPAHVPGRLRKLTVLLRSLITHPQMLLLDDPSVGLGEATLETYVDWMKELRAEGHLRHAFVSSYDETFLSMLPHEIVHLDAGLLYHQPGEASVAKAVSQ